MNFHFSAVESSLNQAEFRWKWLRLIEYSAVLGSVLSLILLFFGGIILCGWITSKAAGVIVIVGLSTSALIAWVVILFTVLASTPARSWLAAALEHIEPRLLDRLNTLLFLEKQPFELRSEAFARRIAHQTQNLVADKPIASPFSARRPLVHCFVFIVALSLLLSFYHFYSPWSYLLAAQKANPVAAKRADQALELAPPPPNSLEQNLAWGEVRITDPGADLKVTKVDVVPLQIEAAANQPLKNVNWFSTVNGTTEVAHELPPPSEPRYAVYQPTIYLDDLQLADWDVMTYYARAKTGKQNSFASEVYFLEVRPFREDILKMPGGEGGQAYQTLSDLSALITRQQHIIRETHQHIQKPPEPATLQAQDRRKLADAEVDLRDATQHLYAKIAVQMENKPIGDALDNLARAEQSLEGASASLGQNIMGEAQNLERSALSELIASRKMFQKAVTDDPNAFADQEEPPAVDDPSKKLGQIAEYRNEAKAVSEFVKRTLDEHKKLEQQAKAGAASELPQLGNQEQHLQKALQDFQAEHPHDFKDSEEQARQAQLALAASADALQKRDRDSLATAQRATSELEKLYDAMQNQAAQKQLADAYRLKQMLDQQIQTLDQRSKPDSKVSEAQTRKTAREARETVAQLSKTAEQDPTRSAFGQPLREALSGDKKVDLNAKINRLERESLSEDATDGAGPQKLASEARDALAKVSRAFEASQPKSLQMAQKVDSLKAGEQDSFAQGMAELDSLIKQSDAGRAISPQDQAKQGQEALLNLQTGLRSRSGDNSRGNQLLLELQNLLKVEAPLDATNLKKLMDELQHFSVETSAQLARNEDRPEITNIDPSRLPPAYRGRIQKYFEKLSEK